MSRLIASMKLDATVQWRNRFYAIGIALSLLLGFGLSQAFERAALGEVIPLLFLFAIGGTTLLYVAGLVIFEKGEGTLDALIVSPLRLDEYMVSKLVTLTFIAVLESLLIVAVAYGLTGFNAVLLVAGLVLIGVQLTLVGFIMIVRYDSITDFLIPVLVVSLVLELPFLYFTGISSSPLWLIIPTSAPTMLLWGAWNPLETWQIIYGLVYSAVTIGVAYRWALLAFRKHIILRERD
jgi:fluoroquinolone transport system permease protein